MDAAPYEVPAHVAIIMDGNGRWAQQHRRPRVFGHHAGKNTVEHCVESCAKLGVKTLTLFAFSTENWRRPETEVNLIMDLVARTLRDYTPKLKRNSICLQILGDKLNLSKDLREKNSYG